MKTARPLFLIRLSLLLMLFSIEKAGSESVKTTRFLPVDQTFDTVEVYLFRQLCAGDFFNGVAWSHDTVVVFFKAGSNNDDTLQTVEIDVIPLPDFGLAGDSLLCAGDTGVLQVVGFFSTYQWSDGSDQGFIEVSAPGAYSVTATASNGCTGTQQTTVVVSMPDFSLELQHPLCAGDPDGLIRVHHFFGGAAPYEVSFNGGAFQADSVFENLPAGNYLLALRDAAGCVDSMSLTLTAPPPFSVEIGPDIFLLPGDTVRLASVATDTVASWNWSPPQLFDCAVCPTPLVLTPASAAVVVTVANSAGCTATDQLTLTYDSEFRLYVPNVFSPNNDGENDFLGVFPGKGNWEVAAFMVFDRWGGLVFQSDTPFRYPQTLEWDGTSRRKQLLPGVYGWAARLRFADGSEEVREGDVTIIR